MTVLVTLLFVAAAALRGYVPGAELGPRRPAGDNPLVSAVVVGLLVASVAVVAVAVVARLRNRAVTPPRVASRPDWLRGDRGRRSWRVALIAFGVVLGWLLLSMLLSRLGTGLGDDDAEGVGATPTATDAAQPATDAGGPPPTPPLPPDQGTDLLGYFYAATAVFVVVLVVGTIVAARRRGPLPSSEIGRAHV